jgi:DNA invertase Pin-like site-specific DNA recombinase
VVIAGAEAAAALAAAYGGERILIPIGARRRRSELARHVRELRAAGLNNCEIARRLGIHLRSVQRLMHAGSAAAGIRDERQAQLALDP